MGFWEAPMHWSEKFDWKETNVKHVWLRSDGKYHFSDECSQFDETPYDTEAECQSALTDYCKLLTN